MLAQSLLLIRRRHQESDFQRSRAVNSCAWAGKESDGVGVSTPCENACLFALPPLQRWLTSILADLSSHHIFSQSQSTTTRGDHQLSVRQGKAYAPPSIFPSIARSSPSFLGGKNVELSSPSTLPPHRASRPASLIDKNRESCTGVSLVSFSAPSLSPPRLQFPHESPVDISSTPPSRSLGLSDEEGTVGLGSPPSSVIDSIAFSPTWKSASSHLLRRHRQPSSPPPPSLRAPA